MTTDDKIIKFPKAKKPHLVLLQAGPTLTLERVIAFGTKFLGRPPTEAELQDMRERLAHLPPR